MIYRRYGIVSFENFYQDYQIPSFITIDNNDICLNIISQVGDKLDLSIHIDSTIEYSSSLEEMSRHINRANKKSEKIIENAAALIAVFSNTSHKLHSSLPAYAIKPDNEDQKIELESMYPGPSESKGGIEFHVPYLQLVQNNLSRFNDRFNGVLSIGEILHANSYVGQFKELIRFFEIAFGRTFSQCIKKLTQFMGRFNLGYTRSEIKTWLEARGGVVHGDEAMSKLLYERDIAKYIARMTQAAIIVLIVKEKWGDNSKEMRSNWMPEVRITDAEGKIEITAGIPVTAIGNKVTDKFGSWAWHPRLAIDTSSLNEWFIPGRAIE